MKLFENTANAFVLKSDAQLKHAYMIFKLIQVKFLVDLGSGLVKVALWLRLPIQELMRLTVFNHFCGGETEEDCLPTVNKMYETGGVCSVLDYSVEGKRDSVSFNRAMHETVEIIHFSSHREAVPFAVFKPSGFGSLDLYRKVSEGTVLSLDEHREWRNIVDRFYTVCKTAHEKRVSILIDAEESWAQRAIDDLAEELMRTYNKDKVVVFNTLQMYRHDRMDYLKSLHERAKSAGFHIGMKVVRGAYMDKERKRAIRLGYPSPICENKQSTDDNFNAAVTYMLNHPKMVLFAGTHNERSTYLLLDLVKKLKIENNDGRLWFGQLYGMSDHITFNLAAQGYNVAKYLPFGPVKEVIPYLMRRAEENTSVSGQANRELCLIETEIKRRKGAQ